MSFVIFEWDFSILVHCAIKESIPASAETKASKPEASDQDYWQNVIGEATINSVLEKMVSFYYCIESTSCSPCGVPKYLLDVLWGQPFKQIQVFSISEFHEYW